MIDNRSSPKFIMGDDGWVRGIQHIPSPNFDARPAGSAIELIVIHNISLPPGQFGGEGVMQLFTNRLNPDEHPYYHDIYQMRVSAHFLIRRAGELIQFVSCNQRAWHAGISNWKGRERCNDFSIGIELEGTDDQSFETLQYEMAAKISQLIYRHYPIKDVTGHSNIAPDRKTDPGPYFDWERYGKLLKI